MRTGSGSESVGDLGSGDGVAEPGVADVDQQGRVGTVGRDSPAGGTLRPLRDPDAAGLDADEDGAED
ncbi:hypothetical protein AB0D12_16025 [Streptomyces sp. NPDC048479]|uniref:hypothetical protein n=1 Tax=Streptomyces sp. NPDC048479 TaxID=3154725 RepID=UPI0034231338